MRIPTHSVLITTIFISLLSGWCGNRGLRPRFLRSPSPPPSRIPATGIEITFYPTYGYREGNGWTIPLRGWVHEDHEHANEIVRKLVSLRAGCDASQMNNVQARTADFLDNDKDDETVTIKFDSDPQATSHTFEKSNRNGIVEMRLSLTDERVKQLLESQESVNGWITYRAVSGNHTGLGRIRFIEPEGVSVVSDIDDTIKVTEIPAGKSSVLTNTFCLDFRTTPEIDQKFKDFGEVPIHYISGGPHQMYGPLYDFLIVGEGKYPEGTFHLNFYPKNLSERETILKLLDLLQGGTFDSTFNHKLNTIKQLMDHFPKRQFILVGDSGEVDPEVYAQIKNERPMQVKEIRIRDLINDNERHSYRLNGMNVITVKPAICPEKKYFKKFAKEMEQRHRPQTYAASPCPTN